MFYKPCRAVGATPSARTPVPLSSSPSPTAEIPAATVPAAKLSPHRGLLLHHHITRHLSLHRHSPRRVRVGCYITSSLPQPIYQAQLSKPLPALTSARPHVPFLAAFSSRLLNLSFSDLINLLLCSKLLKTVNSSLIRLTLSSASPRVLSASVRRFVHPLVRLIVTFLQLFVCPFSCAPVHLSHPFVVCLFDTSNVDAVLLSLLGILIMRRTNDLTSSLAVLKDLLPSPRMSSSDILSC